MPTHRNFRGQFPLPHILSPSSHLPPAPAGYRPMLQTRLRLLANGGKGGSCNKMQTMQELKIKVMQRHLRNSIDGAQRGWVGDQKGCLKHRSRDLRCVLRVTSCTRGPFRLPRGLVSFPVRSGKGSLDNKNAGSSCSTAAGREGENRAGEEKEQP